MILRTTLILGLVGLATLAGCVTHGRFSQLRPAPNITFSNPEIRVRKNLVTSLADVPPQTLLTRWDGSGLNLPNAAGGSAGKMCGKPFVMRSAGGVRYGRVFVLGAHPQGSGPAGRGDYLLAVKDDVFGATSGSRLAVRFESYLVGNREYYGWIAVLRDTPIPCECPSRSDGTQECKEEFPR